MQNLNCRLVEACKKEMEIAGIYGDETDPLYRQAIRLYCKSHYGYDEDAERFQAAFCSLRDAMAYRVIIQRRLTMEATLIWSNKTKDKDGFPVEEEHSVDIYVEEKSATRMEFYEAMRAGVEVKLVLETGRRILNFPLMKRMNLRHMPGKYNMRGICMISSVLTRQGKQRSRSYVGDDMSFQTMGFDELEKELMALGDIADVAPAMLEAAAPILKEELQSQVQQAANKGYALETWPGP